VENRLNVLQSLLIDAQQLARSAQQDYSQKQWNTYDLLIKEFNRILGDMRSAGVDVGLAEIAPMPINALGYFRYTGISVEQAKLREIVNASERLASKLEILLHNSSTAKPDTLARIESICNGFHSVAKSLRKRHTQRPTLDVADEYDVQDLLRSLLAVDFFDVRPEEWTPSYAGGAARMDFLLKSEQVVVETKMSRDSLGDKELGEQLIIDIAKYAEHPDCKTLVCFIYNPLGLVSNAAGLQADLAKQSNENLTVRVLVRPS